MDDTFPFRAAVRATTIAIAALLFFGYVIFQARLLLLGPQIVLAEEPNRLYNTRQIELRGSAANISHLWLNDRPIFTDEQGRFEEALVLENGYTIATLRATDRYGRETRIVRSFVYAPMTFIQ